MVGDARIWPAVKGCVQEGHSTHSSWSRSGNSERACDFALLAFENSEVDIGDLEWSLDKYCWSREKWGLWALTSCQTLTPCHFHYLCCHSDGLRVHIMFQSCTKPKLPASWFHWLISENRRKLGLIYVSVILTLQHSWKALQNMRRDGLLEIGGQLSQGCSSFKFINTDADESVSFAVTSDTSSTHSWDTSGRTRNSLFSSFEQNSAVMVYTDISNHK